MTRKSPDNQSSREMRTALFAGSFNPFTIGHASIVKRALPLFDKIIIAVGQNIRKGECQDDAAPKAKSHNGASLPSDNILAIRKFAQTFPDGKVEVVTYSGQLTAIFAKKIGAQTLLRGVRSVKDFEYEREMADINRQLTGIETLMMFSLPQYACVSSSMLRELAAFGEDVTPWLP